MPTATELLWPDTPGDAACTATLTLCPATSATRAAAEVAAPLSTRHAVTAQTPPTFLWHAADDELVPVENSLAFAAACRRQGVPVGLHFTSRPPHGVGPAEDLPDVRTWVDHYVRFLERHLTA